MSELPAPPPHSTPAADVTRLARPLGVLVPVAFAPELWAFCLAGAPGAAGPADPDRVARYLLTGLVRALRRADAFPASAPLRYRMALGPREIGLAAHVGTEGIYVAGG
jgi:hypothetical protein